MGFPVIKSTLFVAIHIASSIAFGKRTGWIQLSGIREAHVIIDALPASEFHCELDHET